MDMSVEFRAEREDMLDTPEGGPLRVIHRARLYGIALVDRPAYSASELVEARRRLDGLRQRSRGIQR